MDVAAGDIAGGFADFGQRSLSDFGQTGPDKGKGGRYPCILGPGQDAPAGVKFGPRACSSPTFNVLHAFRILTDR